MATTSFAELDAYIECALWSSPSGTDEAEFMDGIDAELAEETWATMRTDVLLFIAANAGDLLDMDPEQVGHDLWLTRNRHGAGFFDRGLGERGERLTRAAQALGERTLYLGDDGLIYMM